MDNGTKIALVALALSVVSTFIAVRTERRASAEHKVAEVRWQLELHPQHDGWILLRNVGRAQACKVRVHPNIGVPVRRLPTGSYVDPGETAMIAVAPGTDLRELDDAIRVSWVSRSTVRNLPEWLWRWQEVAVPTAGVQRASHQE